MMGEENTYLLLREFHTTTLIKNGSYREKGKREIRNQMNSSEGNGAMQTFDLHLTLSCHRDRGIIGQGYSPQLGTSEGGEMFQIWG
jgi:hypothetical protein